jgi:hypothetical protein
MPFALDEMRHWQPVPTVMEWLCTRVIKPTDTVLDIGCGHKPFPRADIGLDKLSAETLKEVWDSLKIKGRPRATLQHDFTERMPFKDKSIDFVYCRHTLEDMFDPFVLVREMERIGKAGYIETPSPVAELAHGIDGFKNSYLWRGYYHHRFFVWAHDGTLHFVSKFPFIEHFEYEEEELENALRGGQELWNTYFLWKDSIPWKHWEMPFDFEIMGYRGLLWRAAYESSRDVFKFTALVNEQLRQAA